MAQVGLLLFYVLFFLVLGANSRHECDRLCSQNETPKKCYYQFTIGITQRKHDESPRVQLTINGKSPGPLISICQDDIIVVDVKNELPMGMETSLHWHGFSEGNSPFMDGVPMITQCPILPKTKFRYQMQAHKTGTFFYRAHSVSQQLDGIHGPLIVHSTNDHPEKVIFIAPKMKSLQFLEESFEQDLNVSALHLEVYNMSNNDQKNQEDVPQKLRIINAAALDCPITLFTHIVPLKVVATDGFDVKPVGLNEVIVNPGERIDLLVKPEVMKVTHIVGHNLCNGHAKYGFDAGFSEKIDQPTQEKSLNIIEQIQILESDVDKNLPKADLRVLLSFNSTKYTDFKGDVDFRYKLGAKTPYAPSLLSKHSVSVLSFHNKSFLYPPSPLLSQPDDLQDDIVCRSDDVSDRCKEFNNGFCECLQIVNMPYNYNVDLFLIDEGKTDNKSHTLYIHGHSFHVLSVGQFDKPISAVELWKKEVLGEIKRNLVNPVKKDTIVVPNKGYVTLRLRPENPGKWLLESVSSKAKTGYGLEVILNVENSSESQESPIGFPTCGNMKEPDLVFMDD